MIYFFFVFGNAILSELVVNRSFTMQTHPNFISLDPKVKGVRDMLMLPLYHQNRFVRKTSPEEMDQWRDDFQRIRLNLDKVDRFYFHDACLYTLEGRLYRMFVRMEHDKERYLFVYLRAHTPGISGFFDDPESGGELFFSSYPHRFINLITRSMYKSLKKDGYEFEWKVYHPIEWKTMETPEKISFRGITRMLKTCYPTVFLLFNRLASWLAS